MRSRLIIPGLVFVVVAITAAIVLYVYTSNMLVWRELTRHVLAQPLTPAQIQLTNGAVSTSTTPDHAQISYVRLANGELWRFAFLSHHIVNGPDSYAVFVGPTGVYRVRGDYFCCQVQLPDDKMPQDSASFLAFLRSTHPYVEHVP